MVDVFGSNVVSAFTSGTPVKAIYNCGQLVWEEGEPTYYIQWAPSDLSEGYFTIDSSQYYFSDYSGYFSGFDGSRGIWMWAFAENSSITMIRTNATVIGPSAFTNCTALKSVYLPNCSVIGAHTFENCRSLSYVYLPKCNILAAYAFYNCLLPVVDLPVCSRITGSSTFGGNAIFPGREFYLRYPSVVFITSRTFYPPTAGTKFYVPSSLVSLYKNAVNWSVYYDYIFPIEHEPVYSDITPSR